MTNNRPGLWIALIVLSALGLMWTVWQLVDGGRDGWTMWVTLALWIVALVLAIFRLLGGRALARPRDDR